MGTAHIWTLLSAAVALCSTIVVLVKLAMASRRVRKAFLDSEVNSNILAQQSILTSVTLRILPHPVFLVLSNVIIVTMDLNISINHWRGPVVFGIFAVFYATPPLFFALVVLFFDPSLSTAIRRLFGKFPTILGATCTNPHVTYAHTIEHPTGSQTNPPSAPVCQSESDLERGGMQAGQLSKPTLYTSDSAEDPLELDASHPPSKLALAPRRRLGSISRATDITFIGHTESRMTAKNKDMDFDTL